MRASSSSKRTRMCRLYVTSSASTRMNEGRTRLTAGQKNVEVETAQLLWKCGLQDREVVLPKRAAQSDLVFPRVGTGTRECPCSVRQPGRCGSAADRSPARTKHVRTRGSSTRWRTSGFVSSIRVVTRTSCSFTEAVKGWVERSWRPCSNSKPKSRSSCNVNCHCFFVVEGLAKKIVFRRRCGGDSFGQGNEPRLERIE